jgi:hypothetical protein
MRTDALGRITIARVATGFFNKSRRNATDSTVRDNLEPRHDRGLQVIHRPPRTVREDATKRVCE